jgi:glutamine amidotransferase
MSTTTVPEETLADVVVVDYGLGNLRSVTRGLERAGAGVTISAHPEELRETDGIVLPGVGAFGEGMENAGPFREPLVEAAEAGTPLFGICLGMQMLLTESEEAKRAGQGDVKGLDLIPGTNVRFDGDQKVPHMGWNKLHLQREHPLVQGIDSRGATTQPGDGAVTRGGPVDGEYAYFVHSYHADPDDNAAVVASTDYGEDFPSIIANTANNVFGTQFHPEKSGTVGLRILRNFVDICAAED